MWHRRMSHCNPRALQQLGDKETTGVKSNRNIESGDCKVCSTSNSKKTSHPPSDRTRAQTRLDIVDVDLWGKHPIKSYGGFQTPVMFTDDKSRMRWGVPIKSKDEAKEALQMVVQDVADPEGLCIVKINCDGGAEFRGRFQALCELLKIIIQTNVPYIPQGNAIAERGFGTIIGTARSFLLGAPHLPAQLWAEAVKTAINIKNRTPTDVLDGKVPLEIWQEKRLGNLLHMHEWGALAFNLVEARFRPNKLAARPGRCFFFLKISLIADGPHHYHPACGH